MVVFTTFYDDPHDQERRLMTNRLNTLLTSAEDVSFPDGGRRCLEFTQQENDSPTVSFRCSYLLFTYLIGRHFKTFPNASTLREEKDY